MSHLLPVLCRGPVHAAGIYRGSKHREDLHVSGVALQRPGESISSWALCSPDMPKTSWMSRRCRVASSLSSGRSRGDVTFGFLKFYLFTAFFFFFTISVGLWCSEAAPAAVPGAGGPPGQRAPPGLGSEARLSHLKRQQEATVMRIRNKCFCLWSLQQLRCSPASTPEKPSPIIPSSHNSPSCLSLPSPRADVLGPHGSPSPRRGAGSAGPSARALPGPLPAQPSNLAHTCLSQIFAGVGWCRLDISPGPGGCARRGRLRRGSWDAVSSRSLARGPPEPRQSSAWVLFH